MIAEPDSTQHIRDYTEEDEETDIDNLTDGYELKNRNPGGPIQVAEPQALLGLGLYLQFPDKFERFTWTFGGVVLDDKDTRKKYSPAVDTNLKKPAKQQQEQ
jgi:hypothetical protein